jgi:hypothetical protein
MLSAFILSFHSSGSELEVNMIVEIVIASLQWSIYYFNAYEFQKTWLANVGVIFLRRLLSTFMTSWQSIHQHNREPRSTLIRRNRQGSDHTWCEWSVTFSSCLTGSSDVSPSASELPHNRGEMLLVFLLSAATGHLWFTTINITAPTDFLRCISRNSSHMASVQQAGLPPDLQPYRFRDDSNFDIFQDDFLRNLSCEFVIQDPPHPLPARNGVLVSWLDPRRTRTNPHESLHSKPSLDPTGGFAACPKTVFQLSG